MSSSLTVIDFLFDFPHSGFNGIRKHGTAFISSACKNSGFEPSDHFPEVRKMVEIGSGARREQIDYELSRYACYLVVQNGDPRKEIIALGRHILPFRLAAQRWPTHSTNLMKNNKRLVVRGNIKQWNQLLAESAYNAGVLTDEEFAIFQNAGYMGLYGGMTVADIHARKGLKKSEKILNHMGSTELIANLFRIS